jgi:AraC-like DNA-binding protein
VEIVFNLCEDELRIYDPVRVGECKRFSGAIVSGTYTRSFAIDTAEHASIVGIHLRPGGAFPFLGVPASAIANTHVDLRALWGPAADRLHARLRLARTPEQRFDLLQTTLIDRLCHSPESHRAVRHSLELLESSEDVVSVRDIAEQIGISHRHLIQVFSREVGLPPKLFHRVRRFQRSLISMRKAYAGNWAAVAAESGYFDQSHLIHDFREFSGLGPSAYLQQRSDRVLPNHVPLAG